MRTFSLLALAVIVCSAVALSQQGPGSGLGPWNNDVLVFRAGANGRVEQLATFPRSGMPTLARLKDGRLILAHQYFPENNNADYDKVAVRFSADDGKTWSTPQVMGLEGLPDGMLFPFAPTLVPLPNGRVRLYFTSLQGFGPDFLPSIYSAISSDGLHYTFEPGRRFGIVGRPVRDCAVVLFDGMFHLFSPDNGGQPTRASRDGQMGDPIRDRVGYHAISKDGLTFTRQGDVHIEGKRRWLGNVQAAGNKMTFFGTGGGGIWIATSRDGQAWSLVPAPAIPGADPGAAIAQDGSWIFAVTGPPRPGTPSARGGRGS